MESSLTNPRCAVTETARDRLSRSGHMPLRQVSCEFEQGVLRLRGRLSSFYQKQLAQETVAGLSGVERVVNEVDVIPPPYGPPDERR
jgi:osmotically-inducible protein OsmY